jgi:hypothetical protein
LVKRCPQRIDQLLIDIAEELDCQMERRRLYPGDARSAFHVRLNSTSQLLLESHKSGPHLLREFDSQEGPDHFKPALFMTVRREIAEPGD